MNPLKWTREKQIAGVIFIVVGAAMGVAFGFLAHGDGHSLRYWIGRYGLTWGMFGAALAGALVYATVLFRIKR
jgi:hypothetical protein